MTAITDHATGKRISAGGIDTHYHDIGSGEPVLLLHGSGPGVSSRANWQHTMPALAQRFRVLAPEMVGYGYTERPGDIRYGTATWVDHVLGFMDALGIEKSSVVGNSMGGLVALHIALHHPERFERMVLMGAPGIGMTPTEGLAALRAYEPSFEAMRDLMVNYFAYDPSIITDDLVRARYEASAAPEVHETYRAMFHDPDRSGNDLDELTEEGVRSIRTPTLLVHGREDRVVPVQVSHTMSNLLPDADLHVFGRCGHWTQIERADHFNSLVADYLAARSSA